MKFIVSALAFVLLAGLASAGFYHGGWSKPVYRRVVYVSPSYGWSGGSGWTGGSGWSGRSSGWSSGPIIIKKSGGWGGWNSGWKSGWW